MNPIPALRIGHGYDLHRLDAPGQPGVRPLVVGGVILETDRGVVAHSDGDVLYHAVVDAIQGALAQPDIGQLFPDSLPENAGRDSAVFVEAAWKTLSISGFELANLDATVILEKPRIGPVKEQMRQNLSRLLRVPMDRVNVKGKSHEKVDAVGERRAVEAHVVVLLQAAKSV